MEVTCHAHAGMAAVLADLIATSNDTLERVRSGDSKEQLRCLEWLAHTACWPVGRMVLRHGAPKPPMLNALDVLIHLASQDPSEVQARAVEALSWLAREPAFRAKIAASHMPLVIQLLSSQSAVVQASAAYVVMALGLDKHHNQQLVAQGAIPLLISMLSVPARGVQLAAARALVMLSVPWEHQQTIRRHNALPPLLDMLGSGDVEGKLAAAAVLINIVNPYESLRQVLSKQAASAETPSIYDAIAALLHIRRHLEELHRGRDEVLQPYKGAGSSQYRDRLARFIAKLLEAADTAWPHRASLKASRGQDHWQRDLAGQLLQTVTIAEMVKMLTDGQADSKLMAAAAISVVAWDRSAAEQIIGEQGIECLTALLPISKPSQASQQDQAGEQMEAGMDGQAGSQHAADDQLENSKQNGAGMRSPQLESTACRALQRLARFSSAVRQSLTSQTGLASLTELLQSPIQAWIDAALLVLACASPRHDDNAHGSHVSKLAEASIPALVQRLESADNADVWAALSVLASLAGALNASQLLANEAGLKALVAGMQCLPPSEAHMGPAEAQELALSMLLPLAWQPEILSLRDVQGSGLLDALESVLLTSRPGATELKPSTSSSRSGMYRPAPILPKLAAEVLAGLARADIARQHILDKKLLPVMIQVLLPEHVLRSRYANADSKEPQQMRGSPAASNGAPAVTNVSAGGASAEEPNAAAAGARAPATQTDYLRASLAPAAAEMIRLGQGLLKARKHPSTEQCIMQLAIVIACCPEAGRPYMPREDHELHQRGARHMVSTHMLGVHHLLCMLSDPQGAAPEYERSVHGSHHGDGNSTQARAEQRNSQLKEDIFRACSEGIHWLPMLDHATLSDLIGLLSSPFQEYPEPQQVAARQLSLQAADAGTACEIAQQGGLLPLQAVAHLPDSPAQGDAAIALSFVLAALNSRVPNAYFKACDAASVKVVIAAAGSDHGSDCGKRQGSAVAALNSPTFHSDCSGCSAQSHRHAGTGPGCRV